jgi:hypothetical protein
MTPENFAYWLKGAIELGNFSTFDEHQVQVIQDHLNLVFNKVTPNYQITQSPGIKLPVITDTTFQNKQFDLNSIKITC